AVLCGPPAAGVACRVQPQVGASRGVGVFGHVEAGDGQRHGALDVVPHVGVPAGEPRDRAGRLLAARQVVGRPAELVRGEYAGQVRGFSAGGHGHGRHQSVSSGLRTYTTTLLPMTGLRSFSAVRVTVGAWSMSHTRSS